MHLSHFDLLLWAAAFVGHIALVAVLVGRHRATVFPVFTALVTVNIVKSCVLFLVFRYSSKSAYFYTYLDFLILDLTLQLGVIFEMARHVFRPMREWGTEVARELIGLALISVSIAASLAFLAKPHTRLAVQAARIRFDLFSAVLVSVLFVGFVVLSVRAGLPWRTHVARISQALAVYAVCDVIIESARVYFGISTTTRFYTLLSQVRIVTYLGCLMYWIITLWQEAPEPRVLDKQMRRQLSALQNRVECDLESLRARRK